MADIKYKILVGLKISDRPKSYDFHCFRCTRKVCEISGADVVVFDDAANVYSRVTSGVQCRGRLNPEHRTAGESNHCPMFYYFEDMK